MEKDIFLKHHIFCVIIFDFLLVWSDTLMDNFVEIFFRFLPSGYKAMLLTEKLQVVSLLCHG